MKRPDRSVGQQPEWRRRLLPQRGLQFVAVGFDKCRVVLARIVIDRGAIDDQKIEAIQADHIGVFEIGAGWFRRRGGQHPEPALAGPVAKFVIAPDHHPGRRLEQRGRRGQKIGPPAIAGIARVAAQADQTLAVIIIADMDHKIGMRRGGHTSIRRKWPLSIAILKIFERQPVSPITTIRLIAPGTGSLSPF